MICPSCNEYKVHPEGGCKFCPGCGWNECEGGIIRDE